MGKIVGKIFAAQQTPVSDGLSLNAAARESAAGHFEQAPLPIDSAPDAVEKESATNHFEKAPIPIDPAPDAVGTESVVSNFEPSPEKTPEKIRCEICGKEYKTAKGLAEPMKKDHPLDILPEDPPAEEKT